MSAEFNMIAMEDREDIAALERFHAEDDGFRISHAIVQRELIGGEHPVKLWREQRGLTVEPLTKRVALDFWVKGVNSKGGFGVWCWDVAFVPAHLQDILAKHSH